ncbi:MAG: DUF4407 domain-containing protein [Pseudobacter sp.]|uniref:DUF4407 domain-containing protein n=1 Tax=Pseudobacter sp. TaxID=2045420 RepID=UPI003F823710
MLMNSNSKTDMKKDNNAGWMFRPKSFISLLGAEYNLMENTGVLKRFYLSSLIIGIILLITGVSIFYAIELLFHNVTVEAFLSSFLSLLFVCIYIFVLNTFTKEDRPSRNKWLNASNLIRTGFVAFMGLLVAQPLLVLLFSTRLEHDVQQYKQTLLDQHAQKIDQMFDSDIRKLEQRKTYCLEQDQIMNSHSYKAELENTRNKIAALEEKSSNLKSAAAITIERNSFFLYQIRHVNKKYSWAWLFTLFIVFLFLLPGYLIYSISKQADYYMLKKAKEKQLIENAYNSFLRHYHILFNNEVEVFSRYEDPPFNRKRKTPPSVASEEDFLNKYLPGRLNEHQ